MVVFYLFGREKQEKISNKKKRDHFCENIRTIGTGFICRRIGFIHHRTGFIHSTDEASLQADENSPPTDEASPIGTYIFLLIFSNVFLLSAAGTLPSESALKTGF